MMKNVAEILKSNQSKSEHSLDKVSVDKDTLRQLSGGKMDNINSSGWICTISGECNGGQSCNPFSRLI
ncbi:hypothetical protein [Alteromonas sp. BMJM2]|uniref:hypothetical protein n=1 Tax=Alteromonas sp. BMJM2 TaxID=2954241 RepID=UPI0022B5A9DB|nr:hypothetical protein [Alteromonas sp. BMJM2]